MDIELLTTEENIDQLHEMSIDCEVGDELPCIVHYRAIPPDPEVGIFKTDYDIQSIDCDGNDVQALFDLDHVLEMLIAENG